MEKGSLDSLPTYTDATSQPTSHPWRNRRRRRRTFRALALACFTYFAYSTYKIATNTTKPANPLSSTQLHEDFATCAQLNSKPAPLSGQRKSNKRWLETTKPLLIRNATIWTGEPIAGTSEEDARAGNGWGWISADVFVDKGLIQKIEANINHSHLPADTQIYEAKGRQLTAGIVDMHSHAGLGSVGNLQDDTNELSSDITPYVRSIDGINPLQPEIEFIKSGGVTTSLFLPGSGNNMGGEAYVLKFAVGEKSGRAEISQQDMLADPDKTWRYMKMACGENPKRVYGKLGEHGPFSRLGEAWQFRHALEQARKYVQQQDDWCSTAAAVGVENMPHYLRQELEWESLGAVLRGKVRINTHCYTIPDLEAFVRHTNEFKFRVYAFHHAHQTYLVPEILKRAWGGTPAAALFADNMYYKVEAYRASERAGAILYAHNITPTYVSDNPVLNSQHVVFEAAKAYGNGLPYHAALAGVMSAPAELLGMGERIGKIKTGYDADIVVWDSEPLSAGAAPVQVWIDGAPQFKHPIELKKPISKPISPDITLQEELEEVHVEDTVVFTGICRVYHDSFPDLENETDSAVAIITNGELTCVGTCTSELSSLSSHKTIALKNGYLTHPLTAFGTALGLQEIDAETDTHDGPPPSDGITFALEGLSFGGKQLAAAFSHGVTRAISAPIISGIDSRGISVGFHTGASSKLSKNAIFDPEAALHYPLTLTAKNDKTPSISSAISALTTNLLDAIDALANNSSQDPIPRKHRFSESYYLQRVVSGSFPLILTAHSADTIASIIRMKSYIDSLLPPHHPLRVTIHGAAEAHLLAREIAQADISLVLAPLLPHAQTWDQRRGLTGPPLTLFAPNILLDAGVLFGVGVEEMWETRDLGLLAGWVERNSEGRVGAREALGMVGRNLERMVAKDVGGGAEKAAGMGKREWVVWEGSPLEIGGRVRGVGGEETRVWG